MFHKNVILVLIMLISGCVPYQPTSITIITPQKHLLAPCKMTPVGELGDNDNSALIAVSEAYIASAQSISECNARLKTAREQIDKTKAIYDSKKFSD